MITLISPGHPLHEISVKSLVGYLESHDIPAQAIYMKYYDQFNADLIEQILSLTRKSAVVGFSLMTKDIRCFLPVIKAIREKQKIPVVLGGIHATVLPEKSMGYSDFVCVGEGEEPLKLLYEAIRGDKHFDGIPNIGYRKSGKVIINPATYFIGSLDEQPFPDYDFRNSYVYKKEHHNIERIPPNYRERAEFDHMFYYSQRGCVYSCTYCSNNVYHALAKKSGHKWYRAASVERVKSELKAYANKLPYMKHFLINDDDFLGRDIKEIEEISAFIKKELNMPFTINAIPSFVTEEKIAILAGNGMQRAAFGVQTGSDRVLNKIYKRPVTSRKVLAAARIISRYNVKADYGFILDNPYENENDWRDSLRLLISLPKPRTFSLYSLQFFPGTELSVRALNEGVISTLSTDFNKDYRMDIKYSYENTLFFLNAYFNLPEWLNNILLSDFIVKSIFMFPVRYLFAVPVRYLIKTHPIIAAANRVYGISIPYLLMKYMGSPSLFMKKLWNLNSGSFKAASTK